MSYDFYLAGRPALKNDVLLRICKSHRIINVYDIYAIKSALEQELPEFVFDVEPDYGGIMVHLINIDVSEVADYSGSDTRKHEILINLLNESSSLFDGFVIFADELGNTDKFHFSDIAGETFNID